MKNHDVRMCLLEHRTTARELAKVMGKSDSYVSIMLSHELADEEKEELKEIIKTIPQK